jgi:hypothetical protein
MEKTLLCHFFNEEFLLYDWLEHHTKIFDKIIMIDYQSTDQSTDLIEYWYKHSPKADIKYVESSNKDFGAMNVDLEVERYEHTLDGWRMCLNVTEFLHGDFSVLTEQPSQHVVPSFMVVDDQFRDYPETLNLDNANNGIPHWVWNERAGRSFHNFNNTYPKPGRHYFVDPSQYSKDFVIFHYGWYPMCDATLNRKLQIQTRIPETDKNNRLGWHHITDRESLLNKWKNDYLTKIKNHSEYLDYWRKRTKKCAS